MKPGSVSEVTASMIRLKAMITPEIATSAQLMCSPTQGSTHTQKMTAGRAGEGGRRGGRATGAMRSRHSAAAGQQRMQKQQGMAERAAGACDAFCTQQVAWPLLTHGNYDEHCCAQQRFPVRACSSMGSRVRLAKTVLLPAAALTPLKRRNQRARTDDDATAAEHKVGASVDAPQARLLLILRLLMCPGACWRHCLAACHCRTAATRVAAAGCRYHRPRRQSAVCAASVRACSACSYIVAHRRKLAGRATMDRAGTVMTESLPAARSPLRCCPAAQLRSSAALIAGADKGCQRRQRVQVGPWLSALALLATPAAPMHVMRCGRIASATKQPCLCCSCCGLPCIRLQTCTRCASCTWQCQEDMC